MTTKDEALKAMHEARGISIACLTDIYEYFVDESVTKNHKKWVLKKKRNFLKETYIIFKI